MRRGEPTRIVDGGEKSHRGDRPHTRYRHEATTVRMRVGKLLYLLGRGFDLLGRETQHLELAFHMLGQRRAEHRRVGTQAVGKCLHLAAANSPSLGSHPAPNIVREISLVRDQHIACPTQGLELSRLVRRDVDGRDVGLPRRLAQPLRILLVVLDPRSPIPNRRTKVPGTTRTS